MRSQQVSGADACQKFVGFVTVDSETGLPVASISRYRLVNGSGWPGTFANEGVVLDDFEFAVLGGNVPQFRRGDANADGDLNLTDAIFILGALFLGEAAPTCADAADTDDSGEVNVTDAVLLLNHLFSGGPAPAAPFAECGVDSTLDELSCDSFPSC